MPVITRRDRRSPRCRRLPLATVSVTALLLAGCGSSGSSSSSTSTSSSTAATGAKPSYCASLSSLEASVKAIPSIAEIKKNGINAVKSQVAQVQSAATAVVNDAKSDFAPQTSAVKSSVNNLSASVKQLSSPPSVSQLAALPAEASSVASATKNLTTSASRKCS